MLPATPGSPQPSHIPARKATGPTPIHPDDFRFVSGGGWPAPELAPRGGWLG
jgi:hypothetical protein